jgi:hypothetical protein
LNICKDFVKFGVVNHNTIVNIFETFAKNEPNSFGTYNTLPKYFEIIGENGKVTN